MTYQRKRYEPPKVTVIKMDVTGQLLASSSYDGPGNHGHSCEHNWHPWCEDDDE